MRPLLSCLLLLFASLGAAPPGAAADDPLRLVSIGDAEAIPGAMVSALAEDAAGFLWIATPAGLVRYDGYRFRLFDNHWAVPDRHVSLFVRSLLATGDGRLWAGTDFAGLVAYDAHAGTLQPVDLSAAVGRDTVSVNVLAEDAHGLWIGTDAHGLLLRAADGSLSRVQGGGVLPDDRIYSLRIDSAGNLWIGTGRGLVRRDARTSVFERVGADDAGLRDTAIRALAQTADGMLWAGTGAGVLRRIDPATRAVHAVAATPDEHARTGSVYAMLQVSDDALWVARANGIDLRDPRDGRLLRRLRHDPARPQSLAADEVRALARSRSGLVWIGGYGGGVQHYDPRNLAFRTIGRSLDADAPLRDIGIRSVAVLDDGRVALGTQDRGVFALDPDLEPVGPWRHADGTPLLPDQRITGLAQTRDGALWIGSDDGLHRHAPDGTATVAFDVGTARARRMLAAPDGVLWVGTQRGLLHVRPGQAGVEPVAMRGGPPLDGEINALGIAGDGALWIGGDRGLARLAPDAVQADWIAIDGDPLPVPDVLGLAFDAGGTLWFDTPAGLYRLEAQPADRWRAVAIGAAPGSVDRPFGANLLFDAHGRAWTQHHVYDSALGRMVALGAADGIDHGSAWFRSYARLRDGRLLFGGSKGLLVVEPEAYRFPDYDPPVVATEFKVDGLPRPLAPPGGGVVLAPGERGFAIEFAALDYSAPERLRYRHRLHDYDPRWNEGDAGYRTATYANLAPGTYRLSLQGSDRSGRWSARSLDIPVQILPAWWQTWWARIGAVVAALLAMAAVIRLRTAMLRARQHELERKVRERTAELETMSAALQAQSRALEYASLTDPLTGLRNRRFLDGHIEADVARSIARHEQGAAPLLHDADLVFFLIDLDRFKQVNDGHGHAAGDAVLVAMGDRLRRVSREDDYTVRWGGEEFLLVARGLDRADAAQTAERVRASVEAQPFGLPDGTRITLTCSIGFAAFPFQPAFPRAVAWEDVLALADAALYATKRAGRNAWLGVEAADDIEVRAAQLRDPAQLQRAGRVSLRSSLRDALAPEAWEA